MAQISLDSIKRIEKYRNTIHDKVYTTYTTFEADGEKYVQIDTYGRICRENPEKISQSFQFDRATAEFLVNLLREEFGLQRVLLLCDFFLFGSILFSFLIKYL